MPQTVYRSEGVIGNDGKLEINVPLSAGTPVEIMILAPDPREFSDLIAASGSSIDFWDNPLDDEDWNDA